MGILEIIGAAAVVTAIGYVAYVVGLAVAFHRGWL